MQKRTKKNNLSKAGNYWGSWRSLTQGEGGAKTATAHTLSVSKAISGGYQRKRGVICQRTRQDNALAPAASAAGATAAADGRRVPSPVKSLEVWQSSPYKCMCARVSVFCKHIVWFHFYTKSDERNKQHCKCIFDINISGLDEWDPGLQPRNIPSGPDSLRVCHPGGILSPSKLPTQQHQPQGHVRGKSPGCLFCEVTLLSTRKEQSKKRVTSK